MKVMSRDVLMMMEKESGVILVPWLFGIEYAAGRLVALFFSSRFCVKI